MSNLNSPLFLFHAAKEFFENGTLYAGKYFKITEEGLVRPFDGFTHAKLCVPASNICFSVELALKGLLIDSTKVKRGHDLKVLYEHLDAAVQKEIVSNYQRHDEYKSLISIRLIKGDGSEHGKIAGISSFQKDDTSIRQILEAHKLAFVSFRYLHEFNDDEEWYFYFAEISNIAFSILTVLADKLGVKLVTQGSSQI